jgi:hypothetical protein
MPIYLNSLRGTVGFIFIPAPGAGGACLVRRRARLRSLVSVCDLSADGAESGVPSISWNTRFRPDCSTTSDNKSLGS